MSEGKIMKEVMTEKELDVCLEIDRVMIMMSNQTNSLSLIFRYRHSMREGHLLNLSWRAEGTSTRLIDREEPNSFCFWSSFFISLESLPGKHKCSIPTSSHMPW